MRRYSFTLLEILLCIALLSIGGISLIHYSYKLTQESLKALNTIELQQISDQELFYWKEYVYKNRRIPANLANKITINNTSYTIQFVSNKKETDLSAFSEEKSFLYLIEIIIKKENKKLFSRQYSILIEVV